MRLTANIKQSLVDNHSVREVLLNDLVLNNRARSVSPEFILEYEEEMCQLYIYDLIAYIQKRNKGNELCECIDLDIINLFEKTMDSILDDDERFIQLTIPEYYELMVKLTNGLISDEIKDLLITLYIYNEAYIENGFLISCNVSNSVELKKMNIAILLEKHEIKCKMIEYRNRYILNDDNKKDNKHIKKKIKG